MIKDEYRENIHKYITGIVRNEKSKLLAINSVSDHIHILVGINPDISISKLVHDVKLNSTKFINENKWLRQKFYWQEGYGAFTYSHSQLSNVIFYIQNQKIHHKEKTFKDEYLEILNKFGVKYEMKYVFDEL